MKIKTLEHYIKHTTIPYPELLQRARKGGLHIKALDEEGTMEVYDKNNRQMILYFEDITLDCLIATHHNYPK